MREKKILVYSSELKQYFFCPRAVYLEQIPGLKCDSRDQTEGRVYHREVQEHLVREAKGEKEKWVAV